MAAVQRGGSLRSVPGASTTKWAARLALVGIIGTVFFIVAFITMYFLRPDDIVRYGTNIGFYSVGPYGSIFVAAFVALGLAGLALALGLRRAVAPSRSLQAGSILVGLFGIGWIVGGIFRDAPDVASLEPVLQEKITPASTMIHGLGAFGGLFLLMAGMLVLSRAFKRDERWHSFWIQSLLLGLATLILFVTAFFIVKLPWSFLAVLRAPLRGGEPLSLGSSSGRLWCGYCSPPSGFSSSLSERASCPDKGDHVMVEKYQSRRFP